MGKLLITVTPFRPDDLEEVMAIEEKIFSVPWSREAYRDLTALDSVRMRVVRAGGELIGYLLFQLWEDEVELHTIGVKPSWQHQGMGRHLMAELLREVQGCGGKRIFLLVRPSNTRAVKLYQQSGFQTVGVRKRYYQDNLEDALVMRCDLILGRQRTPTVDFDR